MRLTIIKFPYTDPKFCERICEMAESLGHDIAAVVSLEKNISTSSIGGHEVLPLIRINDSSWDAAVLACNVKIFNDIVPRMVELKIGAPENKKSLLWILKQFMTAKYEDCADPAIRATIDYWQTHELTIYNQHLDEASGTLDKIFFDVTSTSAPKFFCSSRIRTGLSRSIKRLKIIATKWKLFRAASQMLPSATSSQSTTLCPTCAAKIFSSKWTWKEPSRLPCMEPKKF